MPISKRRKGKLVIDFSNVRVVVIDKYSMVSLVRLAYLDKVSKGIFKNQILFAGILEIISGGAFQLPVLKAQGILFNDSEKLSPLVKDVYHHFILVNKKSDMSCNSSFRSPSIFYVYLGKPVILRINICPSFGLNGGIGKFQKFSKD